MPRTKTGKQDVFTIFSPVFTLCWYIGLCSYIIEGPPGFQYVTDSKLYKPISTSIHVVVILFSLYLWEDSISLLISTPILTLVTALFLVADVARLITNVFFNKFYNAKTIELLNCLCNMERNLAKFGGNFNYNLSKNLLLTCLLVETVMPMSLNAVFLGLMVSDKMRYIPRASLVIYEFYVQLAVDYQFFAFTLLLKAQFHKLNNYMGNPFISGKDLGTIKEVTLLHQKLCEMGRDYNSTLSIPILVCIGFYFCVLLLQSFSFVVVYQSNNFKALLTETITVIPTLAKVMAYIQISILCVREANYMKKILLKLASETDDVLLRKELSAFSLQIQHENFHICAGGFFTIDHQLGLSILGSLTTYTVILIQFGSNVGVYEVIKNFYELQKQ